MGWSARLLEQQRREREAIARERAGDPNGDLYWARVLATQTNKPTAEAENEKEKAVTLTVKISDSNFEVVPPDVYPAVVSRIEEKETMYGPGVIVSFTISDGDQAGKVVGGLASLPEHGLSPKSKLRAWLEAIVGKSLTGFQGGIDLNKLVGKPCRISVSVVPGKDGTGEFNRIKDVLPIRKIATPPPAPQATPKEEASNGEDFLNF